MWISTWGNEVVFEREGEGEREGEREGWKGTGEREVDYDFFFLFRERCVRVCIFTTIQQLCTKNQQAP